MSCFIYRTGNTDGALLTFNSAFHFYVKCMWILKTFLIFRFGSRDCGFGVDPEKLDAFPDANSSLPPCGDANLQEYLDYVMHHLQLQPPGNWESAIELYLWLKEIGKL